MQSLDLLDLQRDRGIAPTEADTRMMACSFRKFTNFLDKGKRLPEIAKPEAPLDAVNFLRWLPVWGLCMKELSLLAREGRNSPATGSASFFYKRFGHIACLSCRHHCRARCGPLQSHAPGFGEKYWSLSGFPSHSL